MKQIESNAIAAPATADPRRRVVAHLVVRGVLPVVLLALAIGWYQAARRSAQWTESLALTRREVAEFDELERRRLAEDRRVEAERERQLRRAWFDVEPPKSAAEAEDRKRLAGSWEIASIRDSGRPKPLGKGSEPVTWRLTFSEAGTFTEEVRHAPPSGGPYRTENCYRIDPDRAPKAIDMTNGSWDRPVDRGIYKVDGDKLTIAFYRSRQRPTSFEPAPGLSILVLRRVAAKGKK